jgi:hypothetical protein
MNMDSTVKPPQPSRLLQVLQPWIVKCYRVAGMVALGAILVGLILFLTGTIFWYFNRTWVRPVILSPEHVKVASAAKALREARSEQSAMILEKKTAEAQLKDLDRRIERATKFEAEVTPLLAGKQSVELEMLHRTYDQTVLEREAASEQQAVLQDREKDLDTRLADQDKLINQLAASPYIRTTEDKRAVGFVPYQNLSNVRVGVSLYACDWGLIKCHTVGKVVSILDGEVQDVHPHDDSVQRGVMVEVDLSDDPDAAQDNVLFAGSKPFWWL